VFKEQGFENPAAIGNHARNIQYVTLKTPAGPLTIVNFHGLWNGQGKTDTEDRLSQSRKIADFLRQLKNLMCWPETLTLILTPKAFAF